MFQRLTGVEVLSLDNNLLTRIPDEISLMENLRELHLKNNKLVDLPIGLDRLPQLSRITVSGNPTTFFENLPRVVLE